MLEMESQSDVERFLGKQRILIADANRSSRVGIARALVDMGATTSQIILADSYEWAEKTMQQARPRIVVLDYEIESRCGLDLLQDEQPDDRLTIMVTHNNSQAAVASAAEGEVDVFISKPYNLDTFRRSISLAIEAKLHPSDYIKAINEGRRYLASSDLERANQSFEKAIRLDHQPALAYFYHGRVQQLNSALDRALASYLKGLEYNQSHYKCLIGLYEALAAQNKPQEAYTVLRRIVRGFPLNPRRFAPLIKLAIQNRRYDDIEEYYDSFLQIEFRNDDIVKHACAGLIVAGKHFLREKQRDHALRLFQKAGISAAGRSAFLKEIVLALATDGLGNELSFYLSRFPQEEQKTTEFQALDFLAVSMVEPLHVTIGRGRTLLKEGHMHPTIYRILIQASLRAGFKDGAEMLALQASQHWPERRAKLLALLSNEPAPDFDKS